MTSKEQWTHSVSDMTIASSIDEKLPRQHAPAHLPSPVFASEQWNHSSTRLLSGSGFGFANSTTTSGRASPTSTDSIVKLPQIYHNEKIVEKIHKQDDIDHMPKWKRIFYMFSPIVAMLSLGSYWVYFALRVKFTLDAQEISNKIFWMAWAFIFVELGVACKSARYRLWLGSVQVEPFQHHSDTLNSPNDAASNLVYPDVQGPKPTESPSCRR